MNCKRNISFWKFFWDVSTRTKIFFLNSRLGCRTQRRHMNYWKRLKNSEPENCFFENSNAIKISIYTKRQNRKNCTTYVKNLVRLRCISFPLILKYYPTFVWAFILYCDSLFKNDFKYDEKSTLEHSLSTYIMRT